MKEEGLAPDVYTFTSVMGAFVAGGQPERAVAMFDSMSDAGVGRVVLCRYVSMYRCIYVSMFLCIYECMHACMHAMHAGDRREAVENHVPRRRHGLRCLQAVGEAIYLSTYLFIYIRSIYIHIHMHGFTHTHIYIYIYI